MYFCASHTASCARRPGRKPWLWDEKSGRIAAAGDISAERIRAHDRFLASDLLEGRGVGQRGGDIAT